MAETGEALRRSVAIGCRVLATALKDGTGQVSARVPGTDEMYLRCRDGRGGGLLETDTHHIRHIDFDGAGPGLGDEYAAPHETPLHGPIYRARPDINAVVHVHPPYGLLCGITDLPFRPIFAGYHPPSLRIALLGVPVCRRAATVTTCEMADQMIEAMGNRDILMLKGHGIVAKGPAVEAATSLAIDFERLAKITWRVAQAGLSASEIPAEDIARYDPRARNGRVAAAWREERSPRAAGGGGEWLGPLPESARTRRRPPRLMVERPERIPQKIGSKGW